MRRIPFLVRLLWDPVRALDLVDNANNPDYAKIIPVIVIVWVLYLLSKGHTISVGMVITLLAASFGQSMFRSFLKARSVTSDEKATLVLNRTEDIKRQIIERHDAATGTEPSP